MTKSNILIITISIVIICSSLTKADNQNLSVPRFASIKSNEVNARTGPSIKCPIEWIFIKKGEPVEIIAEYEQWRQIQDIKGEGGWVHSSVLSVTRSVIVTGTKIIALTKTPNNKSKIMAKISPSVRCQLNKCKGNFCQVRCKNYNGWLPRKFLWGEN